VRCGTWGTARTGRDPRPPGECGFMRIAGVDLSSEIQLHSLHTRLAAPDCSDCSRRLLAGETLHVYDSGRTLCTLCAGRLPEEQRAPLRHERVRATAVGLAVAPRAA
jgi:hypothetical protein